jgi:hypothetical protein
MIDFDLNGQKLALDESVVRELRERALSRAGSSSTLNDLAVILTRALAEKKPVTLRRAESRALERLLRHATWWLGGAAKRPHQPRTPRFTYLRFAEAVQRLDLTETAEHGIDVLRGVSGTAKEKSKEAIEGVEEKISGASETLKEKVKSKR